MKKISYFLSMLCTLALASCSSDDEIASEGNESGQREKLTINVSMPGDDSRVNTDELTNLTWEEGDKIIAEAYDGSGYGCKAIGQTTLSLIPGSSNNSKTASFRGDAINGAVSYRFIYLPDSVKLGTYFTSYKMSNGHNVQNGPGTSSLKDYMVLTDYEYYDINLTNSVVLNPVYPIIKLNIKSLPAIIADANEFDITYTQNSFNYGPSIKAKMHYKGTLKEQNNYLYLVCKEYSLAAWDDLIFDITANGKTVSAQVTAKNQVSYSGGKIYTITLDYNKKGSWTWTLPQLPATTYYTADFADVKTFNTEWANTSTPEFEGLYALQDFQDLQSNTHKSVEFSAGRQVVPENQSPVSIESYLYTIKDLTIHENSEILFKYVLYGVNDVTTLKDKFKVLIKEVGGEWNTAENLLEDYPAQYVGDEIAAKIIVPAKYNNKKVNIAIYSNTGVEKNWIGSIVNNFQYFLYDFSILHR